MDRIDLSRPLSGVGALVTRAPAQAGRLLEGLEGLGADVLHFPVLSIEALDASEAFETFAKVARVGPVFVAWTSANAVVHAFSQLPDTALSALRGGHWQSVCVGRATAMALGAEGVESVYTAEKAQADVLAGWLCQRPDVASMTLLFPCSARARPILPRMLREAGAAVTELPVYRPVAASLSPTPVLEAIASGSLRVLTFASPSTVAFFLDVCGESGRALLEAHRARLVYAAIGPTTAEALCDVGFPPQIVASPPGIPGMLAAIEAHFSSRVCGA